MDFPRYRQKVVDLWAIQWQGDNWDQVLAWLDQTSEGGRFSFPVGTAPPIRREQGEGDLTIGVDTPEFGRVVITPGDWILRDPTDHFHAVPFLNFPDSFEEVADGFDRVNPDLPLTDGT